MKRRALTDYQKRIERSYQRAMNIREALNVDVGEAREQNYTEEYLDAFKSSDWPGFRKYTRRYLKVVWAAAS